MPLPGPDPKDTRRRRNKDVHEWAEVDNIAFKDAPSLPSRPAGRWSAHTRRWWGTISTMPHCCLWDDADWQFAFDTALVHAAFIGGNVKAAGELRQREAVMGTTLESRMKLRIRYVEPKPEEERPEIKAIENYRKEIEG